MGCASSSPSKIQVNVAPIQGGSLATDNISLRSSQTHNSAAAGLNSSQVISRSRSNTSSLGSVSTQQWATTREQISSQSRRSSHVGSAVRRELSGLRRSRAGTNTPGLMALSSSGRFNRSFQLSSEKEREKEVTIFKVDSTDDSLAILTPSTEQTDLDCSQNLGESRNRSLSLSFSIPAFSLSSRICPLCQSLFSSKGGHLPLLLICGHSFCKACLDRITCSPEISRIKCPCGVETCVEQQNEYILARNQALLEMLEVEQLHSQKPVARKEEGCAECESAAATRWCCECGAPYCESCCQAAHEKLRVLSHHKPIPISQRPLPAPMCKVHPGQSYKLYCETDQVPMCLMCKYSNQHRGHQFDLLTRISQRYLSDLQEQMKKLLALKTDMTRRSLETHHKWSGIREEARTQHGQLESHFSALRKELISVLDLRENRLLHLLDSQVQAKQDMAHEFMLELCLALSRVIAAEQEAERLLSVNPVTLLLSKNHMEEVMGRVLLLNLSSLSHNESSIPMSLPKSTAETLRGLVSTHGDVLQIPGEPWFTDVRVGTRKIHIEWEAISIPEKGAGDQRRGKTFSLQFYAFLKDAKRQAIADDLNRSKHLMEYVGWRTKSQRGSRMEGATEADSGIHSASIDQSVEHSSHGRRSVPPVQPEEALIPHAMGSQNSIGSFSSSSQRPLKLPPLIHVKSRGSITFKEDTSLSEQPCPQIDPEDSENSDQSLSLQDSDYNRFEYDQEPSSALPYQEAYAGAESRFTHKSLVPGGTYYYRVRCQNAAGWGPWSKILKCTTKTSIHMVASFNILST